MRGHTEDRCRYKNGTWGSNTNKRQVQAQQHRGPQRNMYPSINATDTPQSPHEINPHDKSGQTFYSTNALKGFSRE